MALPAGWLDTGITINHNGSFTVDVAGVNPGLGIPPGEFARIADTWLGLDVSGGFVACGSFASAGTVSLYVRQDPDAYAARVIVASAAGACPQPRLTASVTVVMTGLRLGVRVTYDAGTDTYPEEYALFADGGTTHTVTVGGKTTTYTYGSPATQVDAQVLIRLYVLYGAGMGAAAPISLAGGVQITNEVWNTESNPLGAKSASLYAADVGYGYGINYQTLTVYPPLKYQAQVRIEDAAGQAPAGNVRVGAISAGEYDDVANAGSATVNRWNWTSGLLTAQLVAPWTTAGITTDLSRVWLRRLRPKRPNHAPEDWSPLTYQIASPVDVLLSANNWSGAGSVALSGTGNKTWTVTAAGASVTRLLAATYDPADSYTTTKHAGGEDVWGWSLYSYLELNISSNVAAALTVMITYNTSPSLGTSTTRAYTINVTNATATYRLDLLWPNSGGPDYFERATQIVVSGFANGVYTLNSCQLVAVENAYVKLHSRLGQSNDPVGGLVIAQDGSLPAYWWGDNPVYAASIRKKDDETGYDGSGAGTNTQNGGAVQMNGTIQDVATEWARMEGITTTYDGTGIAADLTDGTNTLALAYSAKWLHTVMSQRAAANVTKTLYASLRIDSVTLVPAPAGTFILPWQMTIGAMLESICVTGAGARAGADFPMNARRSASGTPDVTDPVIGAGTTDASGFVSIAVPTGLAGGVLYYAYLGAG